MMVNLFAWKARGLLSEGQKRWIWQPRWESLVSVRCTWQQGDMTLNESVMATGSLYFTWLPMGLYLMCNPILECFKTQILNKIKGFELNFGCFFLCFSCFSTEFCALQCTEEDYCQKWKYNYCWFEKISKILNLNRKIVTFQSKYAFSGYISFASCNYNSKGNWWLTFWMSVLAFSSDGVQVKQIAALCCWACAHNCCRVYDRFLALHLHSAWTDSSVCFPAVLFKW